MEQQSALSLEPTTTHQEDLTTAGQRKVNLVWEYTQSAIVIFVVLSNMIAALFNVFHKVDLNVPAVLSSALFMVLGFYLGRTNHAAIGGIGPQPLMPKYTGR